MLKSKFLIFIMILHILLLGCKQKKENRSKQLSQTENILNAHTENNLKGIDIGFSYGIKIARCPLRISTRKKLHGGINYDSAMLSSKLKDIGLRDQDVTKFSIKPEELLLEPDHLIATNKIMHLLNNLREILESKGDREIAQAIRVGFIIGFSYELASITLASSPSEQQAQQFVMMIEKTWDSLPLFVAETRLPQKLQDKLKSIILEIRTINDLRDFRDDCYEFWDINKRLQAKTEKRGIVEAIEWKKHVHPYKFTFSYPKGWTINDDIKHKSTMLLPPGVKFQSRGPKAFFLLMAFPGITDTSSLRSYMEKQLPEYKITSFTKEHFKAGNGEGIIFYWAMYDPQSKKTYVFRVYAVFLNRIVVCIEAYGPSEQTNKYDAIMRKIAASFSWE